MSASTAYILGAGFSRAISDAMPITDELGNECLARDSSLRDLVAGSFEGGTFETWLSRRAEDQPYLDQAENLQSRAVYSRTIQLVADVLQDRELTALAVSPPVWLIRLVQLWHAQRANVLTFNYDTLVEIAVEAAGLYDADENVTVPSATAINFTPTGRLDTTYGEVQQDAKWSTFRLLKLHGSLNWYWAPGDRTGATIVRGRLPGQFREPNPITLDERERWLPGREPLLVPPSSLKSSYYANPITQEIWRQAFRALRTVERVVLLGYSLPQADLSVTGMLTDALVKNPELTIEVVDLNPSPIVERLRALPGAAKIQSSHSGLSAIADYVRVQWPQFLETASRAIVESAATIGTREMPVAVAWGSEMAAALSAVDDGTRCVVMLEGMGQTWFATRQDRTVFSETPGHSNSPPLTAGQLANTASGLREIVVRTHDGVELPVVGSHIRDFAANSVGDGRWFQLLSPGMSSAAFCPTIGD